MTLQAALVAILIAGGLFFLFVSAMGVIRMPDFYTRCHVTGKSETFGTMLILLGLAVWQGFNINSLKLMLILIFVFLANPTATHVMVQGAYRCGLKPWTFKHPQEGEYVDRLASRRLNLEGQDRQV